MRNSISHTECQILAHAPHADHFLTLGKLDLLKTQLNLPVVFCKAETLTHKTFELLLQELIPFNGKNARHRLLICGAFLEKQVSVSALRMLAEGYDVYILEDLVVAESQKHATIHDGRLLQAGAIPTTMLQLLYEWTSSETDAGLLLRLNDLVFQFKD